MHRAGPWIPRPPPVHNKNIMRKMVKLENYVVDLEKKSEEDKK